MAGISRQSASLRPFLGAYFAYVFLFDFILCYAIYTALFELRGLSFAEIGILLAFWSASAIVLELPSGALSDHFDRRWLLVAAPAIKTLTFIAWALADGNFWLYGLGFLFWTIGQSLQSGTREALLYERLEAAGRASEYDKMLGRDSAASSIGIGAGALIGGFVATVSFDLTLWLSVPPLLLGAVIALALRDLRQRPASPEETPPAYLDHFRNAITEFRTAPDLRFVTAYIAVGLILFEILEEFDQLYYLAIGLPLWTWGMVAAVALGALAAASVVAHRLSHHAFLAWLLPLCGGALLLVASLGTSPWLILPLTLAYVVVAPASVLSEARFQQIMEGSSRATTTSALVVAQNITGVLATLGFGFLADAIGILPAYGWAGLCMVPVAIWVFVRQRQGLLALA
jgi:MFS family permease